MRSTTLASALMLVLAGSVWAADEAAENIRKQLSSVDSRLQVQSVEPASMPGLYEVVLSSGETLYADAKGSHLLAGQLYRVDSEQGLVNLTEQKRNEVRRVAMESVDEADLVVYKPAGEIKATINVFTDVDCPYCRKLHDEVPALNRMGVQVNYLAFPRGGPQSKTFSRMESIWCGDEQKRRDQMDKVKGGDSIKQQSCDNPVQAQYELGQKVGITGTPALVLEDGSLLPGYVPAARLQQMLGLN